jgi:hypothetical protein
VTEPVGDPNPCKVGGNIIVFDGQTGDYIHPTDDTITQGLWNPVKYSSDVTELTFTPTNVAQGAWWTFSFSSKQLGAPLMIQSYLLAERYPFETSGHPGLAVGGDGKGCNTLKGAFQIHEIELSPTSCTLKKLTATFEQSCEGTMPLLRGCIHYEE